MKIAYVTRLSTASKMLKHPAYKSAKCGNPSDASILVSDILPERKQFRNLKGFVCPVLKPAGNSIPLALAEIMAYNSGLLLCSSIYLQHTPHGSSMIERLYYRPNFSGKVLPGNYIIVDDVYTTGQTLKSLKDYIECNGGNVTSAYCIGSGPSLEFEPSRILLRTLASKFPDISDYFSINTLTAPQVHYLLRFTSLNKVFERRYQSELTLMFG